MESQNYDAGIVRGGLVQLPIPVASDKQNVRTVLLQVGDDAAAGLVGRECWRGKAGAYRSISFA